MIAWDAPELPDLPGTGPEPTVVDSARGPVQLAPGPVARMYVCGITPYDATHMGHAATYVTFDILNRVLRDVGHAVIYVQNVTDVDDPLLERAVRDGLDWRELAAAETQLFREDMTALRVIPPDHYIGVIESLPMIESEVSDLLTRRLAYRLPIPSSEVAAAGACGDVYLDLTQQPDFGQVSGWDHAAMDEVFADRGGDPERVGKRHRFDPLLWRAARPDEPSWPAAVLGDGRPGWHIECTAIALEHLGMGFDVQGGGTDLIFPHHEMSAVGASALTGERPFADAFVHQAMVGYQGAKMSKSLGNLVLVSAVRNAGVDPMAIRLALLGHHHGADWEWIDADLTGGLNRLARWREAASREAGPPADVTLKTVRDALADDLDTPRALAAIDTWAAADGTVPQAPALVADIADALLGVRL
ncbi:MAG: cysteine--1-D-myo-inosityl 2-amino-2-deoxy-alpha-D-glucopyranoside ligase [Dermatophilaceae bacterium]